MVKPKKVVAAIRRNLGRDAFKKAKRTIEDAKQDINAGRN